MRPLPDAFRIASGCVPRLKLEHWLNKECRHVLSLLDAATLLGLIDRHSYGELLPGLPEHNSW